MRITRVSQYHYELDQEIHLQELGRSDLQAKRWGPNLGSDLPLFTPISQLRITSGIAQRADADAPFAERQVTDIEPRKNPEKCESFNAHFESQLISLM